MRVQSVVAVGLPLLISAILLFLFRDYRTDDTYIYLQFARNLAEGGGFSFVSGEPTFGATSWLWTILLSAGVRLGLTPFLAAKLCGLLAALGAILAVHACARLLFRSERTAVFAASAWALQAWNVRWSFSGLETPLMVLFLVLSWHWTILEDREGRRPWRSGIGWALATLVRPEAIGLLILAGFRKLWLVTSCRRARPLDLLFLLLPSFLAVGTVAIWAIQTFGNPLPNSIVAKNIGGGWSATWAIFLFGSKIILATDVICLAWLLFALAFWGIGRKRGGGRAALDSFISSEWFVPGVWSVVVFLLYALTHSVIVSRYLVPGSLVVLLGGLAAAETWDARRNSEGGAPEISPRRLRHLVPATFLLFAAQNLIVLFLVILPHTREFPRDLDRSIGSIAGWLRENTPAGTTVGAIDIGLLAYESERVVVDLYGLVNPEFVPLRRNLHIKDFVRQFGFAPLAHPDYLVDRQLEPNRLMGEVYPDVRLEPILHREVKALGIRRSSRYVFTLYRLHWDDVAS